LNAEFAEAGVGVLDLAADIGQASVFLVAGDVVGIDGEDDAGEAVVGEIAHVLVGEEGAVGADHGPDAVLGGVADHEAEVFVDHGFAADEEEVSDVVAAADIDHIACLLEGDAAALSGVEAIDGEAAEIALGVADIGDGELEIAGSAVFEDLTDQLAEGFVRGADRLGKVVGGRSRGRGGGGCR
jgi:hypothetical protein